MQQLAWEYHVGKTTVHKIIRETCTVLWDELHPTVLAPPTPKKWLDIARQYYERWNMPNCIGAVDGKHVTIQSPKHSGTEYFSYKKSFRYFLINVYWSVGILHIN